MSNGYQQVDSGTKMLHLGKNTSSRIISKGIAAGFSQNTYRGQVSAHRKASNARNFTNCDSLLIGDQCGAHTVPYIEAKNATAQFEHEATTSKISDDQKFYVMQRGIPEEEAIALIVNGFVKDVIQQLPMEFAVEAQKLIGISLEGSVGWTRRAGLTWDELVERTNDDRLGQERKTRMLEIRNLHARIVEDGTEIIRGLNLTRRRPAKSPPSWGRTAPANRRCPTSSPAARTMR